MIDMDGQPPIDTAKRELEEEASLPIPLPFSVISTCCNIEMGHRYMVHR
jgi:8-oxo-dGTP pyrophosphatase MutT (NUDIX family)